MTINYERDLIKNPINYHHCDLQCHKILTHGERCKLKYYKDGYCKLHHPEGQEQQKIRREQDKKNVLQRDIDQYTSNLIGRRLKYEFPEIHNKMLEILRDRIQSYKESLENEKK